MLLQTYHGSNAKLKLGSKSITTISYKYKSKISFGNKGSLPQEMYNYPPKYKNDSINGLTCVSPLSLV